MDFDADFLEKAKKYLGIGSSSPQSAITDAAKAAPSAPLDIEAIGPEDKDQITNINLPEAPAPQDIELPEHAPESPAMRAPMGMAESAGLRSGDITLPHPAGMADSLMARSGGGSPMPPQAAPEAPMLPPSSPMPSAPSMAAPSKPMPSSIDFGNSAATVAGLKEAQDQRNNAVLMNQLGKAAELFGGGLAGATGGPGAQPNKPTATGLFDENIKQAEHFVKDFKDRAEQEKDDPSSGFSKGMRDYLKSQYGIDAKNASAAQIEKIAPWAMKSYEMNETRKARSEDLKYKYKELATIAKLKSDEKKSAANEKETTRIIESLDPDKARAGNLAQNQKQVYQAERLEQLYTEANGDIRNLDSRQMEELAIGLNKLLSGSSTSAVSQVQALIPHSAQGSAQKLKEWLLNDPQGANQIKFVERMAETVAREKKVAQDQVKATQVKRLMAADLKNKNPEVYQRALEIYGIDPNDIDKKGNYKPSRMQSKSSMGSKPKTVIQNGHTYTLNEQTGQYE